MSMSMSMGTDGTRRVPDLLCTNPRTQVEYVIDARIFWNMMSVGAKAAVAKYREMKGGHMVRADGTISDKENAKYRHRHKNLPNPAKKASKPPERTASPDDDVTTARQVFCLILTSSDSAVQEFEVCREFVLKSRINIPRGNIGRTLRANPRCFGDLRVTATLLILNASSLPVSLSSLPLQSP